VNTLASLLFRREEASPLFLLVGSAVIFGICAAVIYWARFGQRRIQQWRVRNWTPVNGKFDEGKVITMRRGASGDISGYQVWFGYEYHLPDEEGGLYILPFRGEFETPEEAEDWRKLLAVRTVTVRVSPRNPRRSGVSDEDVKPMLGNLVP
jgi:hypothetical protein